MKKLKPKSPDLRINSEPDQTLARLGHLNFLIRKIAFITEDSEEFTDVTTPPTGRVPITLYTITSPTSIDISGVVPSANTTIIIVNHVDSVDALTVVTAVSDRVIDPGEMAICSFIKGNWYLEY